LKARLQASNWGRYLASQHHQNSPKLTLQPWVLMRCTIVARHRTLS
jgi:hypothetical protein